MKLVAPCKNTHKNNVKNVTNIATTSYMTLNQAFGYSNNS
jgi:hypothetical protein